ncbi:hypothetical protein DSECCO2_402710 [anaerobic digester metagenome]
MLNAGYLPLALAGGNRELTSEGTLAQKTTNGRQALETPEHRKITLTSPDTCINPQKLYLITAGLYHLSYLFRDHSGYKNFIQAVQLKKFFGIFAFQ